MAETPHSPNKDCCIDHAEAHALLCELFDENISPARAAEIRAKVQECPECFSQFTREEEVRALVRRCNCTEKAPERLRQRIVQSISITYTETRYF